MTVFKTLAPPIQDTEAHVMVLDLTGTPAVGKNVRMQFTAYLHTMLSGTDYTGSVEAGLYTTGQTPTPGLETGTYNQLTGASTSEWSDSVTNSDFKVFPNFGSSDGAALSIYNRSENGSSELSFEITLTDNDTGEPLDITGYVLRVFLRNAETGQFTSAGDAEGFFLDVSDTGGGEPPVEPPVGAGCFWTDKLYVIEDCGEVPQPGGFEVVVLNEFATLATLLNKYIVEYQYNGTRVLDDPDGNLDGAYDSGWRAEPKFAPLTGGEFLYTASNSTPGWVQPWGSFSNGFWTALSAAVIDATTFQPLSHQVSAIRTFGNQAIAMGLPFNPGEVGPLVHTFDASTPQTWTSLGVNATHYTVAFATNTLPDGRFIYGFPSNDAAPMGGNATFAGGAQVSYQQLAFQGTVREVRDVLLSYNSALHIMAYDQTAGMYRPYTSTDGINWVFTTDTQVLALLENVAQILYVPEKNYAFIAWRGSNDWGIRMSTDGGATFQELDISGQGQSFSSMTYRASDDKLYVSAAVQT